MPRERLTAVDLFAGCGALSAGFANADVADYRAVCANEINAAAAESFRANHPSAAVIARDICGVDPREIGAMAVLLKTRDLECLICA